jgi:hypothetical protein
MGVVKLNALIAFLRNDQSINDGISKTKDLLKIMGISFAIAIGSGFLISVVYFFLMQRCGVYE